RIASMSSIRSRSSIAGRPTSAINRLSDAADTARPAATLPFASTLGGVHRGAATANGPTDEPEWIQSSPQRVTETAVPRYLTRSDIAPEQVLSVSYSSGNSHRW